MKIKTIQKSYTQKDGTLWKWEETPETIEAVKQLHETVKQVSEEKFAGNYPGPLYSAHPDLKNGKETN